MNILIFSWRGPGHPNAGGAEIATHEHSKAWVRAGHNVFLFTSSFLNCKKQEMIDGVTIVRSGNQVLGVHAAALVWFLLGKHPKFDIVVDQFHGIPFFTVLFVRTKVLAYIHEIAMQVWKQNELPKPYNLIASEFGPKIEPLIFKLYKNVDFLTVSSSTKTDLVLFGVAKEKIHIIQNGFNSIRVRGVKKQKILTFLGSLAKDKGIEDAIGIFSEVHRKDDSWDFLIVGKGDSTYTKLLKRKIKKLGLVSKVKFEGFVSERRKFEILAKSFCMINPSIHEGWGLVNIEANSVGTPVVGYKVKGLIDSVVDGKTGMLFQKGEFHQIAMEIIKLNNDKIRYLTLSNNCINWSKKFSWEKSTKESTQLIESL
ncbi:MAG: Glycosyl transferase group 1 [Candidatus Woesebacteria bacterium GW2011_GWA1_39_21]|uniref:Glycosyl transferase group 1 n=1 Tax=Candidatus Woesebacteria bacterium GW2011_GWA1_39_21 TaxID=1618550 RepID=A0A0G0RAF5_9BACT|nr:MAG: Glycosyl transferase group 1 [Candidatus Woesebacteria bacterium GW2011_GWA1_39_21]